MTPIPHHLPLHRSSATRSRSVESMWAPHSQNLLLSSLLTRAAFVVLVICSSISNGWAGGGPENLYLLVNSKSQASMTVANHYIHIRNIPASNVQYLEWDPEKSTIDGKKFREEILVPVLQEIESRGLSTQIDYLIYSTDFPWKVNLANEFPGLKITPGYRPHGSLTGSTYLYAFVKDKRKEMFGINSNNYYSMPRNNITVSRGFQAKYRWLPRGQRSDLKGIPYVLSMMLGATYGRGNTVQEIVRYLQLSKDADATHPKGTVYFLKHDGPRSTPRHKHFPAAVRELGLAGVKSEIIEGRFPEGKQDIIGLTTGAIVFDIPGSRCRMLPGSIGDNLTSAGGMLDIGTNQTSLTDFLLNGAAGACGTVYEPLNYPQKFPSPFIHVHYAHGCSLAEAFYQSIHGPFQQLIVGDPLCQPWATFPEVNVVGLTDGDFAKGTITLSPSSPANSTTSVRFFELFVDGARRKRCRPGQEFSLDTTTLADGHHELRVVAIDNTPIETQGRWIGNVVVKNGSNAVQLTVANLTDIQNKAADHVAVRVLSTQKNPVAVLHNGRKLAETRQGNGSVSIPIDKLGTGPITLQANVDGQPGLFSKPISFTLP